MFELSIEHMYSNYYPKEQSNDSHYFKIKFDTIEKVSEYVNNLYEKTKEYCNDLPCLKIGKHNIQGFVLHTYDFIPKNKQSIKEDIIKLLRDKNDYDNIPKKDIEMYSITVWLKQINQLRLSP